MSNNSVEFGIVFTGDGKVASAEADRVTQSTERLTQATQRQNAAAGEVKNAWLAQTSMLKTSSDEMSSATENVQKLLARYDPLGAKLRSLEADFVALNKAASNGQLGAGQDAAVDKTYKALNDEIAKTKTLMGQAGVAGYEEFAKVEEGANRGAFATAGAKRELMVLGHEALTGNFSRMPGSFMVLAERMSLTTALFNPLTIGAVAFGVATVGVAAAAHKGHEEMVAMNNALAVTNNYSGLTRGGMEALAESMTRSGQVTIGTSKEIVTALVASGRIGAEAISTVANVVSNFAKVTGADIEKIAPEMVKLFSDPLKGAEELNKSMHFLTAADLEQIATLMRLNEVQQAQLFLAQKLSEHVPKQTADVGRLTEGYRGWVAILSSAVDLLGRLNKPSAIEQQIKNKQSEVLDLIEKGASREQIAARTQELADLNNIYTAQMKVVAAKTASTAASAKEQAITAEANKSLTYQARALEQTLNGMVAQPVQTVDMLERERELRKQIADIRRSMGSEGRQLTQDEITYQEKLSEIALKTGADEIETQYKLGKINIQERDARMLDNQLELNFVKQLFEERMASIKGLTPAEHQRHIDRLNELQAEGEALAKAGGNKAQVDDKKFYDDIRKAVDAASQSEIANLDKTIAAQKLHNDEIGKTAEQVALAKRAAEDLGTAQIQAEADALRAAAAIVDMDQQYKDIYIARANALDIEIGKRQIIAGLLNDASFLEANAAASKKGDEAVKRGWDETDRLAREVFTHWDGSLKKLGDTLKTALLSAVYEATLRPLVFQMYTSVVGNLGGSVAGSAAGSAAGGAGGMLGSAYGSFATSSFGQSLGLGTAGIATEEGIVTAGQISALGAALPWVGAGLVIANALGVFGKGGGPQQGQLGTINASGYKATQDYTGGDTLGNQALAQSAYNQVAALYAAAGKQVAGLSINQGGKLDPQGTAAALGYRQISVGGNVISGQAGWDNPAFTGAHDDAAGLATYLGKLTSAEIEQVAAAINDPKLTDAITKLKANFGDLATAMPNYVAAQAAQKTLLDPLLTGTEKLNLAQEALAAAGLPNTEEGFKKLAQSLDVTSQADQDTLKTMISLSDAIKTVDASATSLLDAQGKVSSALRDIGSQVTGFGQKVIDTSKGVQTAKDNISQAYWAAVDTENQLLQRAADNLARFTTSIDDFLATLTPTQSLESLKAQLTMTATLAKAGDVDARNSLVNLGKSVMKASEATSPDKVSNDRTIAFVQNTLTDVRNALAPSQTAAAMAAEDLTKQIAAAKLAVADLGLIATATGVATEKSSIIQLSGADLLKAYNKAIEDSNAAQADYTRAIALTTGLQLTSADSLQSLVDSIYGLGDAEDALVKAGGKVGDSFGITKDEADKLATKLGLSGGAADSFVKALTDPLPGLADSFGNFKIYVDGLIGHVGVTAPGGGPGQTVTPTSLQDTWVGDTWRSPGGVVLDSAAATVSLANGTTGTFASLQSAWADIQKAVGSGQMTELQAGTNIIAAVKAAGADAKTLDAAMIAAGVSGWTVGTANAWAKAHDLPAFAAGTDYFGGGWRVVGEGGPELEATGPSRIFTAQQTRDILSGGARSMDGGQSERIVGAIDRLITDQQAQARTLAMHLVDLKKIHREWDKQGLPSTRIEALH